MAATSASGKEVQVGDQVSIMGTATAISGVGPQAVITVVTTMGETLSVVGNDCSSPETEGPALNRFGKHFSVGDRVSIPGTVQSITGSGSGAQVTTLLPATKTSSGVTVVHSASSAQSPHKH